MGLSAGQRTAQASVTGSCFRRAEGYPALRLSTCVDCSASPPEWISDSRILWVRVEESHGDAAPIPQPHVDRLNRPVGRPGVEVREDVSPPASQCPPQRRQRRQPLRYPGPGLLDQLDHSLLAGSPDWFVVGGDDLPIEVPRHSRRHMLTSSEDLIKTFGTGRGDQAAAGRHRSPDMGGGEVSRSITSLKFLKCVGRLSDYHWTVKCRLRSVGYMLSVYRLYCWQRR